jgi:hypothetical protein
MSKCRTVKFLVENDKLFVGDSFKVAGETFEHFVSYIGDDFIQTEENETFKFSEKIYTTGKTFEKKIPEKTYTFSFKAEVDFEYVDSESESFEQALASFRNAKPWAVISKSKVVDHHTNPELFAIIENDVC